jgi:hypothetical protein
MEIIEINESERLDYEMTKATENVPNFNLNEFLSQNTYLNSLSRKDIHKYLTNYIYDYLNSGNIGKSGKTKTHFRPGRNKKKFNLNERDPRTLLAQKIKKKFTDKDFTVQLIKSILDSSLNIFAGSNSYLTPEEIINEISLFYHIKKTLDFYSTKSLRDMLLKRNFKTDEEFINSKHLKQIYFQHKVVKDIDCVDGLSYSKLKYFLEGPQQLRRPVDKEFGHFRYLPILCRNFCEENFINFFSKLCIEKKELLDKNEEIYYDIKKLFLKNCIFSHNYSEVNFHPLKYKTKICKNKNCQLKGVSISHDFSCYFAHNKDEFVQNFIISQFSEILSELDRLINVEKNKNNEMLKKFSVTNKLIENLEGFDIFNFKTKSCKRRILCIDIKKCNFYHSNLERRRDLQVLQLITTKIQNFNINNQPCENIFKEGKWLDPILCPKSDDCEYFHTRNELFYDLRNFRKIYECPNEKTDGECLYAFNCPYKHSFNISIQELYLPNKDKKEIENILILFNTYSKEYEKLQNKISDNLIICLNCKNYIVDYMAVFNCGHNMCSYCINNTVDKLKDCVFRCNSKQSDKNAKNKNDCQVYELVKLQKSDKSQMNENPSRVVDSMENKYNLNEEDFKFYNLSEDEEDIIDFSKLKINN